MALQQGIIGPRWLLRDVDTHSFLQFHWSWTHWLEEVWPRHTEAHYLKEPLPARNSSVALLRLLAKAAAPSHAQVEEAGSVDLQQEQSLDKLRGTNWGTPDCGRDQLWF